MTVEQRLEMGSSLHRAGRLREAEGVYRQVLAENPNHADALHQLGSLAADMGQLDAAIELINRAIQTKPNVAQFHANLGAMYGRSNRFDDAAMALQRAIQIDPGMAAAHYNLGAIFLAQFEFDRAIAAFGTAIAIVPDWPELQNNLGLALRNVGRHEEAMVAFKRSLALKPDYAAAHWNLSWSLLMLGDFKNGLAEYEWRSKCAGNTAPRLFAQPQWKGEELAGRTILLAAEQGFGDMIQVVRYVPLVAKRGGKVVVECRSELVNLFKSVAGIEKIVVQDEPLPAFDVQCPMMSLPLAFGTTLETIPAEVPYLAAPPERVAAWRERMGKADGRLRVGLVWAGRPTQQFDRWRSSRFKYFARLADVKSVRFFSLQKGAAAAEIAAGPAGMELVDWTADLNDFSETAALIANLDLVIGIESAVTHLAGALGKPVWAVLAHVADWRYMLNRLDSPWYPTMRLFRQSGPGEWDRVMTDVAAALQTLARG